MRSRGVKTKPAQTKGAVGRYQGRDGSDIQIIYPTMLLMI